MMIKEAFSSLHQMSKIDGLQPGLNKRRENSGVGARLRAPPPSHISFFSSDGGRERRHRCRYNKANLVLKKVGFQ